VAVDPQPLDAAMLIRRKRRPDETGAQDPGAGAAQVPVEGQTVTTPTGSERPSQASEPTSAPAPERPLAVNSAGEGASPPIPQPTEGIRMKPRETVSLAVVHARVPEHIARGLKLMSVMEGRQAQQIVAEALEGVLNGWNPRWRESV
jgi:hypothetical protein